VICRIKKLLEYQALAVENSMLRQELQRTYDFDHIIGQSFSMKRIFNVIARIAKSDGTVLITGKSGTGKELVARAIHYHGPRHEKRFVPINCGAIVDTLFESELFGHKKGSFTGATMDKEGLLKVADGGTVFLDEVSEIPMPLQVNCCGRSNKRKLHRSGRQTRSSLMSALLQLRTGTCAKKSKRENFGRSLLPAQCCGNRPAVLERPD